MRIRPITLTWRRRNTSKAPRAIRAEVEEARTNLLEILKPGDTVYTVLRNVSRSGMTRHIDLYVIRDDSPRWISYWTAKVTGSRMSDKWDAVEVGGAGMDMGFALVYSLSRALFPDGFACVSDPKSDRAPYDCPSNDHSNRAHNAHHSNGGYALKQRWM